MSGIYRRTEFAEPAVGRPRKLENVLAKFNKDAAMHWNAIAPPLRAAGIDPVAALESARAANRGAHHDAELSRAFHQALNKAINDADIARHAEKAKR